MHDDAEELPVRTKMHGSNSPTLYQKYASTLQIAIGSWLIISTVYGFDGASNSFAGQIASVSPQNSNVGSERSDEALRSEEHAGPNLDFSNHNLPAITYDAAEYPQIGIPLPDSMPELIIEPFDAVELPWSFDVATFDAQNSIEVSAGLADEKSNDSLLDRLLQDQKNYYSAESLSLLCGGLIVGASMANTSIDESIHRHFQSSIRNANSDDWFESLHASKELGNGKYTLPIFAGAWALGKLAPDNRFVENTGTWGERSMRGFLVGAPPLVLMQHLTGGSRPGETNESSEWHPLRDNNGISGHSFMGALPFITAAKMTERRGLKTLYYAASTIEPLSRMNDNAHYPSQVVLGWWMAYLAASAVDATDNPNAKWRFYPFSTGTNSGVLAEYKY